MPNKYDITGTYTSGIILTTPPYGDPVTVTNTGVIAGGTEDGIFGASSHLFNDGAISGADGVFLGTAGDYVVNAGAITGSVAADWGVAIGAAGSVTNLLAGTITGADGAGGVDIDGVGIVFNAGGISAADGQGVEIDGAGSVYNAGAITGFGVGHWGVDIGGVGSFTNKGGTVSGAGGVSIDGAGTVSNTGDISGASGAGVDIEGVGFVGNALSATIEGGVKGVFLESAGSVYNAGSIHGAGDLGIDISGAGSVTNVTGGAITGVGGVIIGGVGAVLNQGGISGTLGNGVELVAGGYVSNAASAAISGGSSGILLDVAGSVQNEGLIGGAGAGDYGVDIEASGSVTNASIGTITGAGGVEIAGASATLINAGTITGTSADAVYLDAASSNLLVVDAGAKFTGDVVAKAGVENTLELTSSASAGALTGGLGSQYLGFETVTIDAGASWNVEGTSAGFEAATIGDFTAADDLYITDLAYGAGATAMLIGGTLAVTSDGTTIDIALFDPTGTNFYAHDVGGEVLVNESPACYCRGTRIRTDRGQVAVEDLNVGDPLVTVSGALKLIKWIGRRSYAEWLAVGNPDVQPVLFKAGALADRVPSRDLMVSPEHAMYLDGALIPARHLVNGVSIIQTKGMEEIHYFHLELAEHAVIFAEDAASETYVDDGNRFMFHNVYEYYAEHPEAPRSPDARYCAPRIEDGFELEAVRRVLAARATRLRPDGTAAEAQELRGNLDRVTRTLVEGRSFTPDPLVILDNDTVIGRVVPDANHAFRFAMPTGFWREVRHEIEVRREADWTLLPGSGLVLKPEDALAA
jgi:hypothetical protein